MFKRQDVPLFLLERAKGHSDADPFRIDFCERVTKWLHCISWFSFLFFVVVQVCFWLYASPLTELILSLVCSAALFLLIGILTVSPSHEELVHRDEFFRHLGQLERLLKEDLRSFSEEAMKRCAKEKLTHWATLVKKSESATDWDCGPGFLFTDGHEALIWFMLAPADPREFFYPDSSPAKSEQ